MVPASFCKIKNYSGRLQAPYNYDGAVRKKQKTDGGFETRLQENTGLNTVQEIKTTALTSQCSGSAPNQNGFVNWKTLRWIEVSWLTIIALKKKEVKIK